MRTDKRTSLAVALASIAAWFPTPVGGDDRRAIGPAPPRLSDSQRTFLSRMARRALRDAVGGKGQYDPGYIPESLSGVSAEVVVRVWEDGFLRGSGLGPRGPVAEALRQAAAGAAEVLKTQSTDADALGRMVIEIEAAGESQPFPVAGDWTRPQALDGLLEPGIDGLVLQGPALDRRVYPSEFIRTDLPMDQALSGLAQMMHMAASEVADTRLERFRTAHWIEPKAGAAVISLQRGLVLVPTEAVTEAGLRGPCAALAEYMIYRQLDSGLFTYQFDAGADRYAEADSAIAQAGAAVAMAAYARDSASGVSLAAAALSIRRQLEGFTEITESKDAAFIRSADGENKLGLTALVSLAMTRHPTPDRFTNSRRMLTSGILSVQRPSGMFLTAFPPAVRIDAQDYFPGEALLALAEQYALEPSEQVLAAFDRAVTFYREYFRARRSAALAPWQVQAFAKMAVLTKRQDYADYSFELSDWLAAKQLRADNCRWPELWGGISNAGEGPDVSTALHLQGFAEALSLARAVGDAKRVETYEQIVRDAARFVLQLQVRPQEAYCMRSARDVVGGIRTAPQLNRLRIDNCQHALLGLTKARRALYPDAR